jgi:radical SAM protein with 4Fe4S-binding SPASM domain
MAPFNIRTPLFISFEIIYDCNNYCTGCINELSFSRLRQTPHTNWKSIIDSISAAAANVRITGGEPTLHPDVADIVAYLDHKRVPFVIFSHGRIGSLRNILPALRQASHFWGFLISMHGRTAETHERFTNVKHSYRQMLEGIAAIRECRLPFFTTTVIRDEIADDIAAIVEFADGLGAQTINFNRYLGLKDGRLAATDEQLRRAIQEVERLRKEDGYPAYIGNCIPQCFEEYEYPEFQINGITSCAIDPEGNVRAGHHPEIFGNVLKQSLESIWRSAPLEQYLAKTPKPCKSCIYGYTCPGGSRALANKLGLQQDPLIRGPIRRAREKPIKIPPGAMVTLNKYAHIRDEDFGCIIYDLNTMCPLNTSKETLEKLFNARQPVGKLIEQKGAEVLKLIASLYDAGLVEFAEIQPTL